MNSKTNTTNTNQCKTSPIQKHDNLTIEQVMSPALKLTRKVNSRAKRSYLVQVTFIQNQVQQNILNDHFDSDVNHKAN